MSIGILIDQTSEEIMGSTGGSSGRSGALLALGAVTAALVAGVGGVGTGVAVARPVSLTLNYTCDFPVIRGQRVTVQIHADVPNAHIVGVPTRPFPIRVVATVGDLFTRGLGFLGVRSVEGTADGRVDVDAPQGGFSAGVPFTIPNTAVPDSGSFRIPVTGSAPSVRFTRPGTGQITAGNFTLHLAARNADGNPTLGKLDLPCTVDGGQNTVIESFDVRPQPAATATATASAGATGPATSGGTAPGDGGSGAKDGSAAGVREPTASGKADTPTGGAPVTGSSSSGAPASTASPVEASPADGTFLDAAGGGTGHSAARVLLTLGGCAAVAGAVGYGGLLWRRRHTGSEGYLTASHLEEVEEGERGCEPPPTAPQP